MTKKEIEEKEKRKINQANLVQAGMWTAKSILFVSGGSFVSVLAYIGQKGIGTGDKADSIINSLLLLGMSAFLALLNAGITFLIYTFYTSDIKEDYNLGLFCECWAIINWIFSFICLGAGGFYFINSIVNISFPFPLITLIFIAPGFGYVLYCYDKKRKHNHAQKTNPILD